MIDNARRIMSVIELILRMLDNLPPNRVGMKE